MRKHIPGGFQANVRQIRRIFYPFCAICYLITLIFSAWLLNNNGRTALKNEYNDAYDKISKIQSSLDVYFDEFIRTANRLTNTTDIALYIRSPDISEEQEQSIVGTVTQNTNIFQQIHSVYIISSTSDVFMLFLSGGTYSYRDAGNFYDTGIFDIVRSGRIEKSSVHSRTITNAQGQQIDLVTVYGYNGHIGPNGPMVVAVVNIRASWLDKLLSENREKVFGQIVIDSTGKVVATSGILRRNVNISDYGIVLSEGEGNSGSFNKCKLDDVEYYTANTLSGEYGMRVIQFLSVSSVTQKIENNTVVVLLIASGIFAVVTAVLAFTTHLAARPIAKMLAGVKKVGGNALSADLDKHRQNIVRELFIHGELLSDDMVDERLKEAESELKSSDKVFIVEVFIGGTTALWTEMSAKEYESLINSLTVSIADALSKFGRYMLFSRAQNAAFYLFAERTPILNEHEQAMQIVSAVKENLLKTFGISASIIYSDTSIEVSKMHTLKHVFDEVSINRVFWAEPLVLNVNEHSASGSTVVYSAVFSKLDKYEALVSAGEYSAALETCYELLRLSPAEACFAWEAYTRLIVPRICIRQPDSVSEEMTELLSHIPDISEIRSFDEVREWVEIIHNLLCNKIQAHRNDKSSDVISAINEYIAHNFADPLLNVATIAEHFYLSANYLSSLYKKHTGVRLSEVIQNTRLGYAAQLLLSTDKSVAEIAAECGYAYNVNYFQQVFKKKYFKAPRQFRLSGQ